MGLLRVSRSTFHAISDIGCGRKKNEDYWACLEEQGLYVLADGIGGAPAGDLASKMGVDTFLEAMERGLSLFFPQPNLEQALSLLRYALKTANDVVYEKSRSQKNFRGMGTTLSALYFLDASQVLMAHVGDSRVYRFRKAILQQLSKDDSVFAKKQLCGKKKFIYKRFLTKALGQKRGIFATVEKHQYDPEDLFVLCSDGLSDCLQVKEMQQILGQDSQIHRKTKALVDSVIEREGQDNITVILIGS